MGDGSSVCRGDSASLEMPLEIKTRPGPLFLIVLFLLGVSHWSHIAGPSLLGGVGDAPFGPLPPRTKPRKARNEGLDWRHSQRRSAARKTQVATCVRAGILIWPLFL